MSDDTRRTSRPSDSLYYAPYPNGEVKCRPGAESFPHRCDFHSTHHWCSTCRGYYGVPHDGIHEGRNAHPTWQSSRPGGCVCRPCEQDRNSAAVRALDDGDER